MIDSIEDLCLKYDVSHGRVHDCFSYEKRKIVLREEGFLNLLFKDNYKYDNKVLKILDRYYRINEERFSL